MACRKAVLLGREHVEMSGNARLQLAHAQGRNTRGGEFDRERDPVEPAADLGDGPGRFVVEDETPVRRSCALREQIDRGIRAPFGHARDCLRRKTEAWQTVKHFAGNAQRLAARREDRHVLALSQNRGRGCGCGVVHVLAVVEDQHQPAWAQRVDQFRETSRAHRANVEQRGDRAGHEGVVAQGSEVDEPNAV